MILYNCCLYFIAYLLTVDTPLIYGEGRKVFLKLQYEVVRISDNDPSFVCIDRSLATSEIFA